MVIIVKAPAAHGGSGHKALRQHLAAVALKSSPTASVSLILTVLFTVPVNILLIMYFTISNCGLLFTVYSYFFSPLVCYLG